MAQMKQSKLILLTAVVALAATAQGFTSIPPRNDQRLNFGAKRALETNRSPRNREQVILKVSMFAETEEEILLPPPPLDTSSLIEKETKDWFRVPTDLFLDHGTRTHTSNAAIT